MPDNGIGIVLVLIEEIVGRGKRYLVDVLVHFVSRHSDPAIGDGQRFGILIDNYPDG